MVEAKTQEVFSEVYAFLEIVGDQYRNKLPKELIQIFETQKSKTYNPQYDPNIEIYKQNLKKGTLAIIAILDLNYWCETEEEKQKIRKALEENELKKQEEIRKKYNPDNIFENKTKKEYTNIPENKAIIEYKKESIINKIMNKIKSFFRKKQ